MENRNIAYKSRQILQYYRCYRQTWDEFYPSERWVFKRIDSETGRLGDVLDVGCACGGLGAALCERFVLNSYTGIDVNEDCIKWAITERPLPVPTRFVVGDILEVDNIDEYHVVVSLSCVDWNIETNKMIASAWKRVKPRGYFVVSLRLTPEKGMNDMARSYQFINFSGDEEKPEIANYVVLNFKDTLRAVCTLSPPPDFVGGYGYWERPSAMAVTPYDRLIFSVFYIRKGADNSSEGIKTEFSLPMEVFL